MSDPSLQKLERQYQQAKARLQAAKARERTKARKLDARRKIILGAALIDRASRDPNAARLLTSLIASLTRPQDHKAFAGWTTPTPESETAPQRQGDAP